MWSSVFGAGPVGLFAAKSAWLMGAGRVIVIDHLEYRLEKARTFAHAETYNFAEYDDIVARAQWATPLQLELGVRAPTDGGADSNRSQQGAEGDEREVTSRAPSGR